MRSASRAPTAALADDQAEQQRRISERRLQHVVEHVREVFFETDVAGRWTYLNPAWTGVTGFTVEESLGRPFWDFVWDDDVEVSVARFNPLIARGREHGRHEIRYQTKSGGYRWVEVHVQAVMEPGEGIVGTCGTLRDVTAQRDLSEQLVRARETAMMASRSKGDFLANMSHEIRTPMNGVIGLTDLLLETALTAEQREYAEGVKQSADALLTLINDILDISKIEAGKLSVEMLPHDLPAVVRDAVKVVLVKARSKGLPVTLALDPRLPTLVVGDPVRIRQILINLIDNAVKFTADGAVTVAVAPEADADRSSVYFTVADTGTGIARDKLDAVFDTFTQADASTTRRYGGSGLGLAICRQLVELMGGDIGVTSEIGRGSTFWFRLPLATVDAACAVNLPQVERRAEPTLESHRPFRVLVVDDSAINLIVARQFLRRLECDVDVAQDGGTAVDMVSRRAYDVVFMDCQMPVLDGYEATTRIRRLPCHDRTRVVAMTAHAMAGDRERCLAAGMDDYISKPIAAEELKRALSEAVLVADEGDGPSEKAALRPSHEAGV